MPPQSSDRCFILYQIYTTVLSSFSLLPLFLFILFIVAIFFEIFSFVFHNIIYLSFASLRTLTKFRREFLLKCQLIKSSALICTFLIPLVIFRTCRVFFSSFCTSRGFIISPIQETYKKRLSRRYVTHVRSLRAIMSEDEFVELLSR